MVMEIGKLIEINTQYDTTTLKIDERNLYSIQQDKEIFVHNLSPKDIYNLPAPLASGAKFLKTNGEYVWFVSAQFPILAGTPKFYEIGLTKDILDNQQDELTDYVFGRRADQPPYTYAGLQFLQYYANMLLSTGVAFRFNSDFLGLSERIAEIMRRIR